MAGYRFTAKLWQLDGLLIGDLSLQVLSITRGRSLREGYRTGQPMSDSAATEGLWEG
jgi:hypothetical protein